MEKYNIIEAVVDYTRKNTKKSMKGCLVWNKYVKGLYELDIFGYGKEYMGKKIVGVVSKLLGGKSYLLQYVDNIEAYNIRFIWLEKEDLWNIHTLLKMKGYNMGKDLGIGNKTL